MARTCDGCGTKLLGKHGHGWTDGKRVVCGRRRVQMTRIHADERKLAVVKARGCTL